MWLCGFACVLSGLYLFFLRCPYVFFKNSFKYRNLTFYSDRPLPREIEFVAWDALERLKRSELFDEEIALDIFICNDLWRYVFFTRSEGSGGQVNFLLSANAFIRPSDIENNQIIPPAGWKHSLADRPLSYFVAHELIHSLQREFSPFLVLTCKSFLLEGYADYIAKGKTFSLKRYRTAFLANHPAMQPDSGVYNLYCLCVGYLIEIEKVEFEELAQHGYEMGHILQDIRQHDL